MAGKAIDARRALMKNNGKNMKVIVGFMKKGMGTAADVAMSARNIASGLASLPNNFPKVVHDANAAFVERRSGFGQAQTTRGAIQELRAQPPSIRLTDFETVDFAKPSRIAAPEKLFSSTTLAKMFARVVVSS